MATIEERAKMQARLLTCKKCTVCKSITFISDLSKKICSLEGCEECEENYAAFNAYILAATEQDLIARKEERERCIEGALKVHCKLCAMRRDNLYCSGDCLEKKSIRTAMEGGNNGNEKDN